MNKKDIKEEKLNNVSGGMSKSDTKFKLNVDVNVETTGQTGLRKNREEEDQKRILSGTISLGN